MIRRFVFASIFVVSTLIRSGGTPAAPALEAHPARPADSLADAVGVNTHFDYMHSPFVLQWPRVSSLLINSGIRHIRDGDVTTQPEYAAKLRELGRHGIKHSISFNAGLSADQMRKSLAFFAPYVDFVEPMNEYDGYRMRDTAWPQTIDGEQRLLYTTVKSDPVDNGISVIGPSLAQQKWYAKLGPLDDVEDAGNLHNAPCWFAPETTKMLGVAAMTALIRTSTLAKPIWTTETGYNDNPAQHCSLPDALIAKYDPRTVAERFMEGEQRIYFYELTDVPDDQVFGHFGLADADGNAKPQLKALDSMIKAVSDPGPPFKTTPLSYSISNESADTKQLLLEKRNGEYDLLLWRAVDGWQSGPDNFGGRLVDVPAERVTIQTEGSKFLGFDAYNADERLTPRAVARSGNDRYTVDVTDSISILRLSR